MRRTGHRDPRRRTPRWTPKTGHRCAHRLGVASGARTEPAGQRLRAVPRVDRSRRASGSPGDGDLAGSGRRPGFASRYASVRRFVAQLRSEAPHEAHPVIETAPGEEGQVDYGDGPMVRHPASGKHRRTRLFVFTLGYSRKCVRLLEWKSSSQVWSELHEKAFRRLGGAPRVVVLDNLKEGVLTPDVYDAALNPLYRDVLAHYGVTALPCRVRHPDRKGKVESGVRHAQQKVRGLRFETIDQAQTYLDRWEERWADTRIHGTTKRQVAVMDAEEKASLLPVPVQPLP